MRILFALILFCAAAVGLTAAAGEIRLERLEDRVAVYNGDELFTEYRFQERRPCLFPVLGPGGNHLTRRWPLAPDPARPESQDHLHHSGLWFAHGDIRIEGSEQRGDFWHRDPVEHQGFVDFETHAKQDRLVAENLWKLQDGTVLCRDQTSIHFACGKESRWIDYKITIHAPPDRALVLGDTKEGTMAIRVPETMTIETVDKKLRHLSGGGIVNSEGIRDREAWGKRAKWCAYYGPVEGEPVTIALFDHPDNPRHPTWWMARPYGLFAANGFGKHYFEKAKKGSGDFTIPAGDSATFRYRFVLLDRAFDAQDVETLYKKFAEPSLSE